MAMRELGKLEPVPVREIWPHEERDFTPWLANNLHLLNEVLDLELEVIDTESTHPGAGRVDILAKDKDDDANVIIENQLGHSDDSHFARLIGYAASRDARILIWVAGGFWEWHLHMLDWLNQEIGIAAYGVEVSAWRIGNAFAPHLRCVAWPTPQSRRKANTPGDLVAQYNHFYEPLLERFRKADMLQPPGPIGVFHTRWRSFRTGYENERVVYAIGIANEKAWAYLSAYGPKHKRVYRALCEHQAQIDAYMSGAEVKWHEGGKESWIAVTTPASLEDAEEKIEATRVWMFDNLLKLKDAVQPHLDEVMRKLPANAIPVPDVAESAH